MSISKQLVRGNLGYSFFIYYDQKLSLVKTLLWPFLYYRKDIKYPSSVFPAVKKQRKSFEFFIHLSAKRHKILWTNTLLTAYKVSYAVMVLRFLQIILSTQIYINLEESQLFVPQHFSQVIEQKQSKIHHTCISQKNSTTQKNSQFQAMTPLDLLVGQAEKRLAYLLKNQSNPLHLHVYPADILVL